MLRFLFILLFSAVLVFSQKKEGSNLSPAEELAIKAIQAHGGEKFKNMKSLVIRGNADISGSPTATFPATFLIVFSGEDKYFLEINNPFQPFKQAYDGVNTYSTLGNFSLPPINRIGLQLLQNLGRDGFVVSELPEKTKKKQGFRITSPEGYYTDFFLDEKTKRIKAYEASYLVQNRTVTTSVEIDKFREVEGVVLPERYAQRFDLGNLTVYMDFKAKEILVNTEIDEKIFSSVR
ncbi:MAG: hypothetical protein N2Z23_04420 [Pyrinomonadaceae bacterium]|nr:hypothetical protein [Pyrinomonadaceae bacterium]